jgi:hypothetical protein
MHNKLVTLDDCNQITESKFLYAIIHPFWLIDLDYGISYVRNMKEFIQSYEGPILFVDNDLEGLAEKIKRVYCEDTHRNTKKFQQLGIRYLLKSEIGTENCTEEDWNNIQRVIEHFNPDIIKVGGSQLEQSEEGEWGRCVGTLYNGLRKRFPNLNIELDLNLCDQIKELTQRN